MEKLTHFIRENKLALILGALFYAYFLYSSVAGNRICDCESTQEYRSSNVVTTRNHFYHK